jgi:DNA-binding PucR family transcriptional regulator
VVLAPLADLKPGTAQRLAETLRSWLLHQGRRDAVAEDLHIHAQTVRYRMGQLRELYGDRLDDPETVLGLVIALQRPGPVHPGGSGDSSSGDQPAN